MTIPFRGHAPAFPGPAPRPVPAPLPGLPGIGLGGYRPSRAISNIGRHLLNPRNIRNFGIGGVIATLLADWAIERANALLVLWLNGLQQVRDCDPFMGMDTFTQSTPPLATCLTGTGGGLPLRQLGQVVAGMDPNNFIRMLGLNVVTPFGARFYKEGKAYAVVASPSAVRPRPHFSPRAWPWAPPRVGALARPGQVPWQVRPWPVWGSPAPPGTGIDNGYSPPVPIGESFGQGVIPQEGRWTWSPTRPITRPVAPPIARAVPWPRTQETKVGANTPAGQMFFALMRAREGVSEFKDLVETMFKALPKNIQKAHSDDLGSMALALWEHWDDFDFKLWFRNLLANHIEDEIIAKAYMAPRSAARNAIFGNSMGSTGPVAGPGFKDFAKLVNQQVDGAVNPFFGYGKRAEHYKDRAERLIREKAAKERRRRKIANTGLR